MYARTTLIQQILRERTQRMATDPMANNNYLAMPQTGEKTATSLSTYGADEPNANESCCADTQPGPSTPNPPAPPARFESQDTSGPH